MKILRHIIFRAIPFVSMIQIWKGGISQMLLLMLGLGLFSCTDFVEVEPPRNNLVSETVFEDPATVESALANLYHGMREEGMVSGSFGVTPLLGIYSDELDYYGFTTDFTQLYYHNLTADNGIILGWWSQAYQLIYASNDIIKGVGLSKQLTNDEKNRFKGQALFVRAYIHSLLVWVYGEVPYITTTDYLENNQVSRMDVDEVQEQIIADLEEAVGLLNGLNTAQGESALPDEHAAKALLARMYLYTENWEPAVSLSTELIDAFQLEIDLEQVFLKDSPETIWQLKPEDGLNTREAAQLIIQSIPGQTYAVSDALLGAFENGDLRREHWIGSVSDVDSTITLHFAHKYKADANETVSTEYSILFRLGEQYLIRAEAYAHLGDVSRSLTDLNVIRNRAGLPNMNANTSVALLEAIYQERNVELFAEQGLRWFDLKRTGRANEVLGILKDNWKDTDVLLPIPEPELETNPNLLPQNPGY
ncbi:RagB/SusD family nutrient uptake outer membrane protein [Flagellimonas sp.]|uniref:RagB/SusD family nutrient uptake outer membrane protein n=1 Tax=Flagellimonas sp. TaxID=2058762 RepID=UPI003BA87FE4